MAPLRQIHTLAAATVSVSVAYVAASLVINRIFPIYIRIIILVKVNVRIIEFSLHRVKT